MRTIEEQRDEALKDRDVAEERAGRYLIQRDELVLALRAAVDVIKGWHNMSGASDVWDIYLENALEMKPIRAALAKFA